MHDGRCKLMATNKLTARYLGKKGLFLELLACLERSPGRDRLGSVTSTDDRVFIESVDGRCDLWAAKNSGVAMQNESGKNYAELAKITEELINSNKPDNILPEIANFFGLKHIVYHADPGSSSDVEGSIIRLTYPESWIRRYLAKNYFAIDPIVEQGFRGIIPFDWRQYRNNSSAVRNFFGEAMEHGIGPNGLSIPMRDEHGLHALISYVSDEPTAEWHRRRLSLMSDLQVVSSLIHERFGDINRYHQKSKSPQLSTRELEVLKWSSEGKTMNEIGIILSIAETTVRCHIDSARHKLCAVNKVHAVAKAISQNIIKV